MKVYQGEWLRAMDESDSDGSTGSQNDDQGDCCVYSMCWVHQAGRTDVQRGVSQGRPAPLRNSRATVLAQSTRDWTMGSHLRDASRYPRKRGPVHPAGVPSDPSRAGHRQSTTDCRPRLGSRARRRKGLPTLVMWASTFRGLAPALVGQRPKLPRPRVHGIRPDESLVGQ